ncbi:MAG: Uma2 family endonuclease [Thermomicrobiales bacterium]
MVTTAKRLTYDDLEDIPQEREGDRHEIIGGELIVTPAPIPAHQIISSNIIYALNHFVRGAKLGIVLPAPIDIRLTPDNVLIPDIVFVASDRSHVIGPRAIDAPPDLVVEILSPGTRQRDLTVKRALYARFGVREYWIVDPQARTVAVLALVDDRYDAIPATSAGALQSRVLPGLALTLDEVFEGVS